MKLSKIKVSGFKSFVDQTILQLPGQLVAIVGPNGCGKSNIIDAITWVMGESSPKYLRGESLTDVIFNGSSARKPIGQASVELVFDNSDGAISGEYAQYNEISVKRVINRDSDSVYLLNGVRCRKRDIVDIFLGTGLGPRSYSIIGQNMINRMIEAKPDDLRTYLEEAAGISKYKERRRETEIRIQHTKENLVRVQDVSLTLETQLNQLKHQANVAEKFKHLKEEERKLQAHYYALSWRNYDSLMVNHTLKIQREETGLEAKNAELTHYDREIEQIRQEQNAAQDVFQTVQKRFYSTGNEITRLEQDILHHQERKEQWENDLKQTDQDWRLLKNELEESQDKIKVLEDEKIKIEPQLFTIKSEVSNIEDEVSELENEMQDKQNEWDEFNQKVSKTYQTIQVEKTNISHLTQQINYLNKRLETLKQDYHQFNFSEMDKNIDLLDKNVLSLNQSLDQKGNELKEVRQNIKEKFEQQNETINQLNQTRNELQRLHGEKASLLALQQTALGRRDHPANTWVAKYKLENNPRLGEKIEVEKDWQMAVEKVIGSYLQAICVDELPFNEIKDFETGNLSLITLKKVSEEPSAVSKHFAHSEKKAKLLLEKINCQYSLDSIMANIYIAKDLNEAMQLCQNLEAHESVITKEGYWLNRYWLTLIKSDDPQSGVFEREQKLQELNETISTLEKKEALLLHKQQEYQTTLAELEMLKEKIQKAYQDQQSQCADLTIQKKVKIEKVSELKERFERHKKEESLSLHQLQEANKALENANTKLNESLKAEQLQSGDRKDLIYQKDSIKTNLQQKQSKLTDKKNILQAFEIKFQTLISQKNVLQSTMCRIQDQLANLNDRKINLQKELDSLPALDHLKKSLSQTLDKHVNIENELNSSRHAVQTLEEEFRNLERKRHATLEIMNKIRQVLEGLRIEWQGWKVKADSFVEQIQETEFTLENVLKELTENDNVEECKTKLDQINQRIARLGPINLMAIDEYQTASERKTYLDNQLKDLQEGLKTLEDAISKIDKETKTRFKETFDKVNHRFQELFPTIFGGGRAYLALTSEDLLEAGIAMMACPPGKRNSNIYLLSGGEKSLTAIAFIFSIFYLNPAPFCLLDEVDAALDDTNVLRFTRLMKMMSEKTQFLFISHNKISIETAHHLIGVTMSEPGVSRLVSVDIEKAMTMAGNG